MSRQRVAEHCDTLQRSSLSIRITVDTRPGWSQRMITDQLRSAEVEARVLAIANKELRRTSESRFTVKAVDQEGREMRLICDRALLYFYEYD